MTALPPGFRLRLDEDTRVVGNVMLGGQPARALRLTDAGRVAVEGLLAPPAVRAADAAGPAGLGAGVAAGPANGSTRAAQDTSAARTLARRLVDGGLAHPVPVAGRFKVEVVVPVRDRAEELDRCLAALGAEAPVTVVDDGSADPATIAAVCARHGASLVRCEHSAGPAAARNRGVWRETRGMREFPATPPDLVAFLDSDCEPRPGWLQTLTPHFTDPLVGAVAPRITPRPTATTTLARYLQTRSPLDMGPRPAKVAPGHRVAYMPSAALIVRASALETFDPALRYGEDVDLVWRLHDAGWQVRYEPEAHVDHHEPATWKAALARRYRYGTAAAPLHRRHPGRLAPAVLEPWPTAAAVALLTGRPRTAAALAAAPTLVRLPRLHAAGLPAATIAAHPARATLDALTRLSRAATTVGAPVLVAAVRPRKTRRAALALAATAPLAEYAKQRPRLDPARWIAASLADDAAYGLGVIRGCLADRTTGPLMPILQPVWTCAGARKWVISNSSGPTTWLRASMLRIVPP